MLDRIFLSVGAMKAGTTWLYDKLRNHPDIYFTPEKELHYFANKVGIEEQTSHQARLLKLKNVLDRLAKANLVTIRDNISELTWYTNYARVPKVDNEWYESLFDSSDPRKVYSDFSNLYCQMGVDGWSNVRKVAKNIRVIYTLRDPVKRLWSHYKFHMKWTGRENETIDAGFDNFKHILSQSWFFVNAQYARNYSLLRDNLRTDELGVYYFEDFRSCPKEMLNNIVDFLGIDKIEMQDDDINKVVNSTLDLSIPPEWEFFLRSKLEAEISQMKALGLWHPNWQW